MARTRLTTREYATIDAAVSHHEEYIPLFKGLAEGLQECLLGDQNLGPYIHFIKNRVKSPGRLRAKLIKKALQGKRGDPPAINSENLFTEINDLAGVRILHLHTTQLQNMRGHIDAVLDRQSYKIVEGPTANCWDVEYEGIYRGFQIETATKDSLYTSVHYILQVNEKNKFTVELQVRTLMEEVWGEVSHRVGYEEEKADDVVSQQLKVLARLTSGSTRLVDCIFDTYRELITADTINPVTKQ